MATYFWVGGTGTYDGTTNHFATTSGGVATVAAPTSADTATFDTLSNATAYTVTISAGFNCSDLTMGAPLTGAVTWAGASAMNIFGNFNLSGGTTGITRTYTGTLSFRATSGTKTITSAGIALASNIVINGSGGTFQLVDGFNTSGSTWTTSAGTFDGNSQTVTFSGQFMTMTNTVGITFYNLSRIPSAPSKIDSFAVSGNFTVSNLFTVSDGATVTNRVLISSQTVGTAVTITAASISTSNSDWQDITGAGAASWNMASDSGGSGDCGGNSMKALGTAAFTTAATQTFTNTSGGSWSTSANWTSRVPLPQDNVSFATAFTTARTVTSDMQRLGASIDFTGATWTTSFTWASSAGHDVFGSVTMIAGITITNSNVLAFRGRGAFIFTTANLNFTRSITVNTATANSLTLSGNLTITDATRIVLVSSGTFSAGNNIISAGLFQMNGANATITFGSATHILNGTGNVVNVTAGTVTAFTGTLKITDTSNTAISFLGGSKTYFNIWWSRGASTATNTITGTNTFFDFKDDGTGAHTIVFPNVTTTITNGWHVIGASSSTLITLARTGAAGTMTLSTGSGLINTSDNLSISNSTVTGGALWYAGANSTNGGGNTGWIFTNSPKGNFIAVMN